VIGLVGLGGENQGYLATGAGFDDERAEQDVVRQKARRHDPQAATGLLNHRNNSLVKRIAGHVWPAGDHLKIAGAVGDGRRDFAVQCGGRLAGGEAPVGDKNFPK